MSQHKIQLIRVAGVTLKTEITPEEKKYRENEFPDEKKILKKSLVCTSCGKDVKDKIISQTKINVHPVLEVIWCKKCEDFYEDGDFSVDEDGSDKYCRWCAQGGDLYCCSYCSVAFCSKCVKRNLPRKTQKCLEDDDWRCFVCVSEPLWPLRALCDAAKRYVEGRQKTRKPTRAFKVEELTEEDTTGSEVSTRRSKRRKPNDMQSTEDEKQSADSEDNVSGEVNKSKRKYAGSSEESRAKKRGRRGQTDDEEIPPHPDEKNKVIYEATVTETLSDCRALFRILSKKEANLKKNHLGVDVLKLNECIDKADEDFCEFFKDAKTSLEKIEKNYEAKIASLRKARADEKSKDDGKSETTTSENDTTKATDSVCENVEPEKENETVDEPDVNKDDDTIDEIMEVDSTVAQNASPPSSRKSSVASVNEKADEPNNMSIVIDDDANLDKTDIDKSKSVSDSLAVNIDSIVDSLRTDESQVDNTVNRNKIYDDTTISDIDLTIDPPTEKNDLTENNVDLEPETIAEEKINEPIASPKLNKSAPLSPLNKDKIAKQALLQSSSDNASSSENENVVKKSSDSDISGVSVLHSDSNTNNSKHKKLRKRKTLDKLNGHSPKKDNKDKEVDKDKEIDRLTNLNSLEKRSIRSSSSEGNNSEKENVDKEKQKNLSSSKKKKEKVTIVEYFSDESGHDTDDSKISLSKFNSYLESKQKAFLDGTTEQLSKKVLLDWSSDEEDQKDETIQEGSPKKDSPEKPNKKEKLQESKKKTIKLSSDEELEKEKKSKKNDEKSKWRQDAVFRGKLSETDTSDEERIIQRHRLKEQREAEKTLIKTENSSDSEELFRPKKRVISAKKRKTKLTSSGSDFELKDDEDSDDSVQIISYNEPKNKKRRRIKRLDDSNSSAEEDEGSSKTPGSASKGRKNIRKVLQEEDLAELTVRTAKEEAERKKRIADKQALYNDSFQMEEGVDKQLSKLVLDFDPKTKEELVSVHPTLIKKLKPHQAKGVKFMWDSCFESVKMATTTRGGGCILAHCMGLGKTLQVITLVHTVMRYPDVNVNRVLIICPLSTVLNWVAEFEMWLQDVDYGDDINVFNLSKCNSPILRSDNLNNWFNQGGVMILGYEMFRNLVNTNKVKKKIKQTYLDTLLDPGPDLVVCDEGHMLKNEASALSQATMKIKTLRRIVLTGTPLQNNLKEYHCMVQFIKPNLLGDRKEFLNRFANPITNGQYSDSTTHDVRVMKRRAHVLHKMLDGVVQRMDYNVLTPFLPAKHEFVILIALSDLQAKLYQHYIDNYSKKFHPTTTTLFKDYQIMRLIWTHPYAMKLGEDRKRKLAERKNDDDSEGSLKDFVVDSSEESGSDSESGDKSDSSVVSVNSGGGKKKANKSRMTRAMKKDLGLQDEDLYTEDIESAEQIVWWKSMISEEEMEDYRMGPKIVLLFAILRQCESIGDKLLVFSQSIPSLNMIEYFLEKWDSMEDTINDKTETPFRSWDKGLDYFRLDGQTPTELRTMYCNRFNKTSNLRGRLFLISTKAGGLGINLTAANRVIIFDASWNPSYDVQSIFRIYRFGQNKPCYIYRFLAQGTMEEKIYERQVTKLSISCRVVDEQQIDRHFNTADVEALYEFNRKMPSLGEVPKLPKDRLMAELLQDYKHAIVSYHEHDSLLENIAQEELTEEERKQAWEDYENEKKGLNLQTQQTLTAAQADFMFNKATIMAALKKEHPDVSETQLQVMYGMVRDKLRQHYTDQIRMQQMQQMRNAQTSNVGNPANPANPAIATLMQQRQAIQQMQQMQQNAILRQHLELQARERLERSNTPANSAPAKPT